MAREAEELRRQRRVASLFLDGAPVFADKNLSEHQLLQLAPLQREVDWLMKKIGADFAALAESWLPVASDTHEGCGGRIKQVELGISGSAPTIRVCEKCHREVAA